MGYIILVIALLVAALVARSISKRLLASDDKDDQMAGSIARSVWSRAVPVAVVLLTVWNSAYQVSAGHVGIIYRFGAIIGQTGEGLQFVPPWASVYNASLQVQSKKYEKLASFDINTQTVYVAATVNFHVAAENVQTLYQGVGSNYVEVLIDPRVAQDFKDVTVTYTSVDIAPNREKIRREVARRITDELKTKSIIVEDVLLTNIWFKDGFETAIEDKQVASQDALKEATKVEIERQKALQKVAIAGGDAEAILVTARKQAEANDLLKKSISPELIQYMTISKLAPNVTVMMLPAGEQFILGQDLLAGAAKKQ